jgi:molybdenum cofactor cytidylyltransferase
MRDASFEFGIILLAAGGSTRMGRPKLLLPFRGRPLLRRAAESAIASGAANIIVVLGAGAEAAKSVIADLPLIAVVNERWPTGMGSSLKTGLAALLSVEPTIAAAIVMLADQPMIGESAVSDLIAAQRQSGKPICAAAYAGTLGPPALFAASQFARLAQLGDAEGAKRIFSESPDDVAGVPIAVAALDIDTPGDYDALTEISFSRAPEGSASEDSSAQTRFPPGRG